MKKNEYLSENESVLETKKGLIDDKSGSWITGEENEEVFPESVEGGE